MEENKQPSQRYLCNVRLGQYDITINGNAVATKRGILIETLDIRGTVTDIGFANWKKHVEAVSGNLFQFQALAPAGEGGAVFLDPEQRYRDHSNVLCQPITEAQWKEIYPS